MESNTQQTFNLSLESDRAKAMLHALNAIGKTNAELIKQIGLEALIFLEKKDELNLADILQARKNTCLKNSMSFSANLEFLKNVWNYVAAEKGYLTLKHGASSISFRSNDPNLDA